MNKDEAKGIIQEELEPFRLKPYAELVLMIEGEPFVTERVGPSGTRYQIEIEAFWDDKSGGDVRVIGSIDDGGWRAFMPLGDDFIKSSLNKFVGE